MTPEQIAEHMMRIQVGMLQCRGQPARALAMLGAMMHPFRQALSTPGTQEAKFQALRKLVESLPAETLTATFVTILGFIGNGLSGQVPGPQQDLAARPPRPGEERPEGELE